MKRLLLTGAVITAAAFPAMPVWAQTATQTATETPTADMTAPAAAPGSVFVGQAVDDAIFASTFIGKYLYIAEHDLTDTPVNDAAADWSNVGDINDVLLSRDGTVEAVLVDVGGFLGVGARTVAVDMGALRLIADGDAPGEYFVVFTSTRAALEAAPEFKRPDRVTSAATPAPATGTETEVAATDVQTSPAWVDPGEGYVRAEAGSVTADQLKGAEVYDATNESIGKLSDVVLTADGRVEKAIVDVGGFLGIGAKPVAVGFDQFDLHRQVDGDGLRVYLKVTRAQLEAMPAYEGA